MRSVKGKFQNGVATPTEPIEGHEGESVLITFLGEDRTTLSPADDSGWVHPSYVKSRNTQGAN